MPVSEQIHNYVEAHKGEILSMLKELLSLPSIRCKAEPGAPYGRACAEVLEAIRTLYEKEGVKAEIDREGGYLLAEVGEGARSLGLFAHADVVEVENDWIYTSPFVPTERDGYLIGRGTLDDKSAVVASLWCFKAIKELALPLRSRLVAFVGTNEESGMADMDAYLAKHKAPDFALVCDTAFPLYRGDKCGLNFWVRFQDTLTDIANFEGGHAMNAILGHAAATVRGERVEETGISRHSALPEGSVNAGYLLAKRLAAREDLCVTDRRQMQLLAALLEKYYGEVFGIEHSDECGRLTCTSGMIRTEEGHLSVGFNMRFGLSADVDEIRSRITDFFTAAGCTVTFEEEKRGYLLARDDPYIRACLRAYTQATGDQAPAVYINAGGTYARKLSRAAEIGTTLRWGVPEGTPPGHGGAHQSDECIHIRGFFEALELTLAMLLACDEAEV